MSKNRSRTGPKTSSTPKPGRGSAGSSPPDWIAISAVFISAVVASVLLTGYSSFAPLVVVPIMVGALVWLMVPDRVQAVAVATLQGIAAAAVSVALYSVESLDRLLNSMPAYANLDVPGSAYTDFLIPLLGAGPVASLGPQGPALVVVSGAFLPAATVLALTFGLPRLKADAAKLRQWCAYCVLGLLVASFMYTGWSTTSSLRATLDAEPAEESYAFDPIINLKTYYLMRAGADYYTGIQKAALGDTRINEGVELKNGKFSSWGGSVPVRQPEAWWLWRVLAPTGGGQIWIWAWLLCAGWLAGTYLAFKEYLSHGALLAPMLVMPYLLIN